MGKPELAKGAPPTTLRKIGTRRGAEAWRDIGLPRSVETGISEGWSVGAALEGPERSGMAAKPESLSA